MLITKNNTVKKNNVKKTTIRRTLLDKRIKILKSNRNNKITSPIPNASLSALQLFLNLFSQPFRQPDNNLHLELYPPKSDQQFYLE